MDKNKIIYWVSTGLLSLLMLFSAFMYVFQHSVVKELFVSLGYPTYLIYPLAIAKLLGLIAILSRQCSVTKNWAYAGFTYVLLLGLTAHLVENDNSFIPSLIALIALVISYIYDNKVFKK